MTHDLLKRLMKRIVKEDRGYVDECWVWTGEQDRNGYGRIKDSGRYVPVHWVVKGVPPWGYEVDHLCKTRSCVKPSHLEYVTRAENNRRREFK